MKCVHCERSSDQVPLIRFEYQGSAYAVCPEHLPIMIHKPAVLVEKFPDAASWPLDKKDTVA